MFVLAEDIVVKINPIKLIERLESALLCFKASCIQTLIVCIHKFPDGTLLGTGISFWTSFLFCKQRADSAIILGLSIYENIRLLKYSTSVYMEVSY